MSRDGHDRAGPVVGQDVVGDVDGQPLAVHGVDRVQAGRDAGLLRRGCSLGGLLHRRPAHVVAHLVGVDARHELVLGREDEEGRAVERVRARREDGDVLVELLDPELDLRALRAADPVALARLDRLGPVDRLEVVEERLRVVRDPEEPLLHEPRLDLGAAALAAPLLHLLVREHGLVVRAPLHRRGLPVHEAALEEAQELPLLPAVVAGVVRRGQAIPVVRPADAPIRPRDGLDVALGALARVDALADRGVLGRQAERVEALRMEDVHPVSRAEARGDVADRVHEHVPHVQRPRRVREHLEDVALRLHRLVRHLERLRVLPDALPLLLDCACVVPVHRLTHSSRGHKKASRARGSTRTFAASAALVPWSMQEAAARAENGTRQDPAMLEVLPVSARVENGELTLGGVSASELADRFGTPLVVYCEETLRQQARALLAAAEPDGRVFYGTKAFANVAALRILREEGIGADVASTGELAFARAAGFAGADLVVHGNNKDEALLRGAAGEGAPIVLDAPDEAELAAAAGVARVLVRVTLGVDADTHEAVVTGHHGSKFGLPPERGAERSWQTRSSAASTCSGCTCTSARSYPTSRLRRRRSSGWRRSRPNVATSSAGRRVSPTSAGASASATARRTTCPRPPTSLPRPLRSARAAFASAGLAVPAVWLEPGRSLVGRAGVTLYRVGAVKRLAGRTWVAVDGGMSDNPRPQLYDARYTALSAARADEDADETVSVAGMHCESGDVLIDDVELPDTEAGRPACRSRDRGIHPGDELELQRRRPPSRRARRATAPPCRSAGARRSTTCSRWKRNDLPLLRRPRPGRVRLDGRGGGDADVARARGRREGLARRRPRLAGRDRPRARARRAGGRDPAPRPPQPRLRVARGAIRRTARRGTGSASRNAVRLRRRDAAQALARVRSLVGGDAHAGGGGGARHEPLLHGRDGADRRPRGPAAHAAEGARSVRAGARPRRTRRGNRRPGRDGRATRGAAHEPQRPPGVLLRLPFAGRR